MFRIFCFAFLTTAYTGGYIASNKLMMSLVKGRYPVKDAS